MTIWQGGLIILATASAFPSMYGLYRLVLWMKQGGLLSWRNQRTGTSAMNRFVAMQQIIEPGVKHVQELKGGDVKNTPTAKGPGAEARDPLARGD